jgi:hypothetical protein
MIYFAERYDPGTLPSVYWPYTQENDISASPLGAFHRRCQSTLDVVTELKLQRNNATKAHSMFSSRERLMGFGKIQVYY